VPPRRRAVLATLAAGIAGCVKIDEATPTASQERLRWQVETDGRVVSSPVISDGKLYVGSADGAARSPRVHPLGL
jgi:outer membrane protein assembly factor BamB